MIDSLVTLIDTQSEDFVNFKGNQNNIKSQFINAKTTSLLSNIKGIVEILDKSDIYMDVSDAVRMSKLILVAQNTYDNNQLNNDAKMSVLEKIYNELEGMLLKR